MSPIGTFKIISPLLGNPLYCMKRTYFLSFARIMHVLGQVKKISTNYSILLITENLQYLRLGDNNLHSVPTDALRRLHRLRHLDLRANNITVLPEDAFFGYGDSITFLNLQKNL